MLYYNQTRTSIQPIRGLKLDGINDRVDTNLTQNLPVVSVSIFLRNLGNSTGVGQSLLDGYGLLSKQSTLVARNFSIEIADNRFIGGFLNGSTDRRVSFGTLDLIQIHHLVLTISATSVKAYLNNDLINQTTGGVPFGAGAFIFGNIQYPRHPKVIFYDTKIYNKELSISEINTLHESKGKINPAVSNTVADWRFQEKQGVIAKDKANVFNGSLINFNSTSLGVNNAWVDEFGNSILA